MPGGGGGGNGGGHRNYHKKGGGGGGGGKWWNGKKRGGGGERGGGESTKKARIEQESLKYRMGESKPHGGSYAVQQADNGGGEQGELGGKKKVALVIGYCGTGYQGMQMNPGATSIEAELEKAMFEAGCIKEANFGNLQKIAWSRAGRTDKGVHAAAQVVGCKLHVKMKEEEKKEAIKTEGIKTEDGEANEVLSAPPSAGHGEAEGIKQEDGETTETAVSSQPPKQTNVASWSALSTDELAQAFEDTRDAINAKLPACIQVHGIVRATRGFNAKNDCIKRRYCYMLPTFLLEDASVVGPSVGKCVQVSKKLQQQQGGKEEDEALQKLQEAEAAEAEDEEEGGTGGGDDDDDDDAAAQHGEGGDADGTAAAAPPARNKQGLDMSYPQPDLIALKTCFQEKLTNYRVEPARLEKLRATLRRYLGTHKFHNFSIRMSFRSGQVKRYIMDIEASDPFVREDGVEWTCITLTGQAFLLHQIRKMVAVAVMITRGAAPEDLIETAYGNVMLTLPMAPSDGLFLDMAFFDRYNERATQIGSGSSLEWEADHSSAGKDPLLIPPPPAVFLERLRAFKEAQIVGHITRSESTTLAFSKWLYHMHYRFERTETPFSPRELTLGEQRSEVSKKQVIKKELEKRKLLQQELEQRQREQQEQQQQQELEQQQQQQGVGEGKEAVVVAVAEGNAAAAAAAAAMDEVAAASLVGGEVTQ